MKYVYKILDLNIGAELEQIIDQHSDPQKWIPGIPGMQQAMMQAQLNQQAPMQQGGGAPPLNAGQVQAGGGQPPQLGFESLQRGGEADFSNQLG